MSTPSTNLLHLLPSKLYPLLPELIFAIYSYPSHPSVHSLNQSTPSIASRAILLCAPLTHLVHLQLSEESYYPLPEPTYSNYSFPSHPTVYLLKQPTPWTASYPTHPTVCSFNQPTLSTAIWAILLCTLSTNLFHL